MNIIINININITIVINTTINIKTTTMSNYYNSNKYCYN